MIHSLDLINFQKHSELSLQFDPGVNVIVGGNYKGKSTLLRGILFSLFGVSAVPGGSKGVQNRDSDTPPTTVTMVFTVGGQRLEVLRTANWAKLTGPEEEVLASGTTAVNAKVIDLLGMTKSDFLGVKYSRQKEASALVAFGVRNMNELIERVCGADTLAKLLPMVKERRDVLSGRVQGLEYLPLEPIDEEIAELELDLGTLKIDHGRLNHSIEAALEEIGDLEFRAHEGRVSNRERENVLAARARAASDLDAVQAAIRGLGDALTQADVDRLEAEVDTAVTQAQTVRDHNQADLQIEQLRSDLEAYSPGDNSSPSEDDVEAKRAATFSAGQKYSALQDTIRTLDSDLESGVCSACDRPFDNFDPKKIKDRLVSVRASSDEAKIWAEKLDAEWRVAKASLDKEKIREANWSRVFAGLTAEEAKRDRLPECPRHHIDLAGSRAAFKRAVEYVARKQELDLSLDEEWTASEAAAALSLPAEVEVEEITGAAEYGRDKLQSMQTTMATSVEKSRGIESTLVTLRTSLREAEGGNQYLQKTETDLDLHKRLLTFLLDNRESFMRSLWDSTLSRAAEFCRLATDGSIEDLYRKEGEFIYVEDGFQMSAKSQSSGAQSSIIGLSLKLALATSLPDSLSCLLLDEISSDMDPVHSATVTSLLDTLGHQVIMVTHQDLDRSSGYNLIEL